MPIKFKERIMKLINLEIMLSEDLERQTLYAFSDRQNLDLETNKPTNKTI
jgi:hypothetical protein